MGGRSTHCGRRVSAIGFPTASVQLQVSTDHRGRMQIWLQLPGRRSRMETSLVMSYLKLERARIILGCFLVSAFVLSAFPEIDIGISRIFFEQGFHLKDQWWYSLVRNGLAYLLSLSMIAILGIYVFNRLSKRDLCSINGRKVSYLFL